MEIYIYKKYINSQIRIFSYSSSCSLVSFSIAGFHILASFHSTWLLFSSRGGGDDDVVIIENLSTR